MGGMGHRGGGVGHWRGTNLLKCRSLHELPEGKGGTRDQRGWGWGLSPQGGGVTILCTIHQRFDQVTKQIMAQ